MDSRKAERKKTMQVILLYRFFVFLKKNISLKRQKRRNNMKKSSETKAGIIALNVISDDNFLEINGVKIKRKEYMGQSVLSVYDVSSIHQKEVRAINQQFKRNKEKFIEGKDYFRLKRTEIDQSHNVIGSSKHSSNEFENLFTERGYIKLTRTFSDDFSWKVQDILIDEYFNMKKLRNAIASGEIEITVKDPKSLKKDLMFDVMEAETKEESMAALAKFNREYIKPLEINDARYRRFLDKNGTIRATDIAGMLGTTPAFINLVMNYVGVIVKDGKRWKPQKEWGGKGIMKLIETSYFLKRLVPDEQSGNAEQEKEENDQQLLPLQSDGNMPAVPETVRKEVDKIEFRYTIEGAELIEKIFLESGLVTKDENGNYSENKELAKIMRSEYSNFKETGKRHFKIDNNIIIFPEN